MTFSKISLFSKKSHFFLKITLFCHIFPKKCKNIFFSLRSEFVLFLSVVIYDTNVLYMHFLYKIADFVHFPNRILNEMSETQPCRARIWFISLMEPLIKWGSLKLRAAELSETHFLNRILNKIEISETQSCRDRER